MQMTGRELNDRRLFDEIASRYSRKDRLPAQSRARRLRLEQTVDKVPTGNAGRVLEPGCGAGYAARYMEGRYATYVGFDYSAELVAIARDENGGANRQFIVGDARQIEFEEKFDLIVMIGVLHHMEHTGEVMANLVGQLRPGGWLIANEPQGSNPLVRAARALRKRLNRDYSDDQDEYSTEEMRSLLSGSGLEAVAIFPQGIFSTPFAEVAMPFQALADAASRAACAIDPWLERRFPRLAIRLSWNLIAAGRRPAESRRP